jgi:hypothetical protein
MIAIIAAKPHGGLADRDLPLGKLAIEELNAPLAEGPHSDGMEAPEIGDEEDPSPALASVGSAKPPFSLA